MPLYIEQFFPLGRFHATRWRQNPFADPCGEWPPSPWRLLRSIAARWYEYSRETGDRETVRVERVLAALAAGPPVFSLPELAWRGPALRQYQPTGEFAWSDPNAGSGAVKESRTSLFPDAYWVVDPRSPVVWQWERANVEEEDRKVLGQLLSRITYFGRAESLSRLRLVTEAPAVNCRPDDHGDAPVLCFSRNAGLRLDVLLARSDEPPLENAPVPPGTEWVYYRRPSRASASARPRHITVRSVRSVQFSVGADLFPPEGVWTKVTEGFRRRVLRAFCGTPERLALLAGKSASGEPSSEHNHPFYVLWPDEAEEPTRLIVWRKEIAFDEDDIRAMLEAATKPLYWSANEWALRLVPLPLSTPPPPSFNAISRMWVSATRFVRPPGRHAVRANGRVRASESVEEFCSRLIGKMWRCEPETVEVLDINEAVPWMRLHEPGKARQVRLREGDRTSRTAPGYRLRVAFKEPFEGPLIAGDSAHFGLGAFRRAAP